MYRKFYLFISLIIIFAFLLPGVVLASSPIGTNPTPRAPDSWDMYLPLIVHDASSMVSIPAGNFQMGCDPDHNAGNSSCESDQLPLHTVYLDAYSIDKYEVTNDQIAVFLTSRESNDCDGYDCVHLASSYLRISYTGGQYVVDSGYGDHPVVDVTWYGANSYCTENGKRLPTEAEWEKAARGTSVRTYPWGDGAPNCTLANYDDFYYMESHYCVGDTTPVGSYPLGASPYGALDMAGNVFEWVNDWYSSSYYSSSPSSNPPGPEPEELYYSYKVVRGGGRFHHPYYMRTANRESSFHPDAGSGNVGFRCGVSATSSP
jgi:formylglycine-generating enzyme required for sulfatase activity